MSKRNKVWIIKMIRTMTMMMNFFAFAHFFIIRTRKKSFRFCIVKGFSNNYKRVSREGALREGLRRRDLEGIRLILKKKP